MVVVSELYVLTPANLPLWFLVLVADESAHVVKHFGVKVAQIQAVFRSWLSLYVGIEPSENSGPLSRQLKLKRVCPE